MKKLLFVFILVLSASASKAQLESFVRSYDAVSTWDNQLNDWGEWNDADIVVAYNYKGTSRVAVYYGEDEPIIFTPIKNEVTEEINSQGNKYQEMKYLSNDGEEVTLLLFDKGTLILGIGDDAFCFSPID